MATEMMHLFVGMVLKERLQVQNASAYYTGCVAPDSVHMASRPIDKATRWSAHARHGNLKQWTAQAKALYASRPDEANPDFWQGYLLHLLTDIAWDAGEHDPIWFAMKQRNLPPLSNRGAGWDDCFRFDYQQMQATWWCYEVRPALLAAQADDMPGLPARTIVAFAHKVAVQPCECEGSPCPPYMVDEACVRRLAESVWALLTCKNEESAE